MTTPMSRRHLAAAAPFLIVPRHVLGMGFTPPSDKITLASIGMGRQGMAVTMDLLERPDVQVIAVCDVNKGSKDYAEYGNNALLTSARRMLGKGYEQWGTDLASPGSVNLTHTFRTSLGMGGRDPAKRMVDAYYASRNNTAYKGCAAYADFRELLDKTPDLDAVYVATPDHWHAPIALAAMKKKKHVLGQKPMAHSIGEARRMAALAAETKVATSLPVNNPTSDATKLIAAWIADGAIGKVKEVHNWSSRPYWPQGVERPSETMPVPEHLDWDMWVGPAPVRPYHKAYLPFVWRGWFDFGCGSFGDMGCYSFAGIYKILGLSPPSLVEASTSEPHSDTYPAASIVHMDFPAANGRGPVHLAWYDGGLMPARPAGIRDEDNALFRPRGEGILYIGDKGILLAGFNGQNPRVYPEQAKYTAPRRQRNAGQRERDGAIDDWLAACKGGPSPEAGFPAQRPVTEAFLLGCMAQRLPGERLLWDTVSGVLQSKAGAPFVDPPYRGSWS